ncbi:DUF2516 family protein [Nesterenkonia suensis]
MQPIFAPQCFGGGSFMNMAVCFDILWLQPLFGLVCLAVAGYALFKVLPKDAQRFDMAFKRTKGFWLAMTGGAVLMCFFGVMAGAFSLLFPAIGATMAAVYLADVEPAVSE